MIIQNQLDMLFHDFHVKICKMLSYDCLKCHHQKTRKPMIFHQKFQTHFSYLKMFLRSWRNISTRFSENIHIKICKEWRYHTLNMDCFSILKYANVSLWSLEHFKVDRDFENVDENHGSRFFWWWHFNEVYRNLLLIFKWKSWQMQV